jgi:two-component system sensor histidine kinase GlrK
MLGYLLLLAFGAGMSVYAIVQLGKVQNVTHSIILVDNALLDFHKSLTDALLSETRYEKKFVIMHDAALYEGFLKSNSDFNDFVRNAMVVADSAGVRDTLARIADLHAYYQALFQDEAGMLKAGQAYDAAWYAEAKEQFVNALLEELSHVRLLSQGNVVDKVTRLSKAGARASNMAMMVTAASLVAGVLLSLVITRSITVPLSRMEKKTAEIGSGVYDANLKIKSPPEIGALARAFNFMCTKLKEVDTMKTDFFSLMSHELRTPLTSIKEGTNLLLEGAAGPATDKQKRILTIMAEESNRLIGLVSSLLDLSKLEAGMLAYQFTQADLAALVTQAVGEISPLAEAKNIRIDKDVQASLRVTMDPERILQVIRNLLGNALKFTPQGGTVRILGGPRDGGVGVSVTDTGPGIPKEHQAVIFDKYRQATQAGTSKIQGTGLGLAIVKHIVQDHGGRVWVESEIGRGSTFTFVLPA